MLRPAPCALPRPAADQGACLSAHRRPAIRFRDAPRGTCRWCGEAILHGSGPKQGRVDARRRWHPDCVAQYNLTDPRELRRLVRKRDRGVCRACGLDTSALRRKVRGLGRATHLRALARARVPATVALLRCGRGRCRAQPLRELGFQPRRSLW